jgi:hypothetical protein
MAKDSVSRQGGRTNSVRRPYSVTFEITQASSYAPVIMCRTRRLGDLTPVEGDRAGETVASGPNQL